MSSCIAVIDTKGCYNSKYVVTDGLGWGGVGVLWREGNCWRVSGLLVPLPSIPSETTQTRVRTTAVCGSRMGWPRAQNLSGPVTTSIILTWRSSLLCPPPVAAISALKAHLGLLSRRHLGIIVSYSNLSFPPLLLLFSHSAHHVCRFRCSCILLKWPSITLLSGDEGRGENLKDLSLRGGQEGILSK